MRARLGVPLRHASAFAGLCWAISPPLAVLALVVLPALSALLIVQAIWLRWLVDGAVEQDLSRAITAAVLLGLTQGLDGLLFAPTLNFQVTVGERLSLLAGRRFAELANSVRDLSLHEDPQAQDYLVQLQRTGVFNSLIATVAGSISSLLRIAVGLVILVAVHPLLILVPLVAVPSLLVVARTGQWIRRGELEAAQHDRLARHWVEMAQAPATNRELRVYQAGSFAIAQQDRYAAAASAARLQARRKVALAGIAAGALTNLGLGGVLAFLLFETTQGSLSAGQLVAIVFLLPQIVGLVNGLHGTTSSLHEAGRTMERYLWLVDRVATSAPAGTTGLEQRTPPRSITKGLSIADLTFTYPRSSRPVLSRVNLDFAPGSVVAIVGENGAGKTTLAKLLARLYEPDRGSILLDGEDLREFELQAWRKGSTACYQDFARLEFSLREAVAAGDLESLGNDASVQRALGEARATPLLASLPGGLDTQLGKTWPGGVELSLGQWQRVALARSRMRPAAAVTILDEPSASLDAQTEYELFDAARSQTKATSASGGITILISHRFSTVQMADHIVVLKDGSVVEQGSHRELMEKDGLYAELYQIQSAAYAMATPTDATEVEVIRRQETGESC